MGDAANNGYVPFQITYMTDPIDGYTPLNPLVVPCNQAVNVSFYSFDSISKLETLSDDEMFIFSYFNISRTKHCHVLVLIANNLVQNQHLLRQEKIHSPFMDWMGTKCAWLYCL